MSVLALRKLEQAKQFSGPEWCNLLNAGRARYVYGFAALSVGLEAMAKTARRQTGEDEGRQNRAGLLLRTPAQADRAEHGNSCAGSGALWLLGYKFELVDHSAELWKRTCLHLVHRPAAVDLHRSFGDADIAGNLFAEATARDLNHDLALPWAK